MLTDFFKLNSPFNVFTTEVQLTTFLRNSIDLRDVLYQPSTLSPVRSDNPANPFFGKTFTNVSFSKTRITGVVFRDCNFVDCLFIATRFADCEFHGCTFTGCNPYKVIFENTYIDPSVFEGMLDPVKYWNIGIHLFQQLYDNSTKMHQREFANSAEFNRYKWTRYVLNFRYPGWKKRNLKYISGWLSNFLFYAVAGYGIRSKFLAAWAFISGAGSVTANYIWWDTLSIVGRDGPVKGRGIIEVFYYTITIPVGVGDFTPASDAGKLIFAGEAML